MLRVVAGVEQLGSEPVAKVIDDAADGDGDSGDVNKITAAVLRELDNNAEIALSQLKLEGRDELLGRVLSERIAEKRRLAQTSTFYFGKLDQLERGQPLYRKLNDKTANEHVASVGAIDRAARDAGASAAPIGDLLDAFSRRNAGMGVTCTPVERGGDLFTAIALATFRLVEADVVETVAHMRAHVLLWYASVVFANKKETPALLRALRPEWQSKKTFWEWCTQQARSRDADQGDDELLLRIIVDWLGVREFDGCFLFETCLSLSFGRVVQHDVVVWPPATVADRKAKRLCVLPSGRTAPLDSAYHVVMLRRGYFLPLLATPKPAVGRATMPTTAMQPPPPPPLRQLARAPPPPPQYAPPPGITYAAIVDTSLLLKPERFGRLSKLCSLVPNLVMIVTGIVSAELRKKQSLQSALGKQARDMRATLNKLATPVNNVRTVIFAEDERPPRLKSYFDWAATSGKRLFDESLVGLSPGERREREKRKVDRTLGYIAHVLSAEVEKLEPLAPPSFAFVATADTEFLTDSNATWRVLQFTDKADCSVSAMVLELQNTAPQSREVLFRQRMALLCPIVSSSTTGGAAVSSTSSSRQSHVRARDEFVDEPTTKRTKK